MKNLWSTLPLLVILFVIALGIHDFLSLNEPKGKGWLVVEGWIEEEHLSEIKRIFKQGSYDKIAVTGTVRPFVHYLNNEQRLELHAVNKGSMEFELEASGVHGARMAFISDGDTLFDTSLEKAKKKYTFTSGSKQLTSLTIKTYSTVSTDWSFKISFINGLRINKTNPYLLFSRVIHYDRRNEPSTVSPNYAMATKQHLLNAGFEEGQVLAITPGTCDRSAFGRTACNARSFAQYVSSMPNYQGDLVSLGVHARRSYNEYESELPEAFELGVISLKDAECGSDWYLNSTGRFKVVKEIGGIFFGNIVDPLKK